MLFEYKMIYIYNIYINFKVSFAYENYCIGLTVRWGTQKTGIDWNGGEEGRESTVFYQYFLRELWA